MKRDIRLHGLSSDHHHALVLARRIRHNFETAMADAALVETVLEVYRAELQPHFEVEESLLLPALADAGRLELVERTRSEHEALRAFLAAARAGQVDALERFASLLEAHVRFEERELFPACEALLAEHVLDDVAVRAPKRGRS